MRTKTCYLILSAAACLLALMYFPSCSAVYEDPGSNEMSKASYRVYGTVTDEEGAPIKGIQVACGFIAEGSGSSQDNLYTDKDGRFEKSYSIPPCREISFTFSDIDGDNNGGSFNPLSVKAVIVQTEYAKGSFSGSFIASYDARLSRK
ncbi:MAG: radical SAM-associated putative lipoprotein [Bacteroidales bacterium]|nr:radical SAM-associated putative lipoprotein [Bacteroidales bacterium]